MVHGNVTSFLKTGRNANRSALVCHIAVGTYLVFDDAPGLRRCPGFAISPFDEDSSWGPQRSELRSECVTAIDRVKRQGNILITPSGRACITDFGLSAVINDQAFSFTAGSSTVRPGTIPYTAPELFVQVEHANPAADIYAFACVCYEVIILFCKRYPHKANDTEDIFWPSAILSQDHCRRHYNGNFPGETASPSLFAR
jgi:hypothetical protein